MTQKAPVGHSIRKRCPKTWDTSNRCLSPAPNPGQAWFRLDPAFDSEKPRPHSCPLYPSGSVSTFFWESVQITRFSARVPLQSLGLRLPRTVFPSESLPGSGCQLRLLVSTEACLGALSRSRQGQWEGERRRRGRGAGGRWRLEPGKKEGAGGREEAAGAGRGGREPAECPSRRRCRRRRLRVSRRGWPGWAGPGAPPAAAPVRRAPGPPGAPHR